MAAVQFTQSLVRITRHTLAPPPPSVAKRTNLPDHYPLRHLIRVNDEVLRDFSPDQFWADHLPTGAAINSVAVIIGCLVRDKFDDKSCVWYTPLSIIAPFPSTIPFLTQGLSRHCLWLLLRALPAALGGARTTSASRPAQLTIITEAGQEDIPFTTPRSFFAKLQQTNLKRLWPLVIQALMC